MHVSLTAEDETDHETGHEAEIKTEGHDGHGIGITGHRV